MGMLAVADKKKPTNADTGDARPARVRKTSPVNIDAELARRVSVFCSHRRINQSDFLSDFLKQYVNLEYEKVYRAICAEVKTLQDEK